jgi:hypothetical protein
MSGSAAFSSLFAQLEMWWPQGDSDSLRTVGDAWLQLAEDIEDIAMILNSVAVRLADEYRGDAASRFQETWKQWGSVGGEGSDAGYLSITASDCRRLAGALHDFANDVAVADHTLVRLVEQALQGGMSAPNPTNPYALSTEWMKWLQTSGDALFALLTQQTNKYREGLDTPSIGPTSASPRDASTNIPSSKPDRESAISGTGGTRDPDFRLRTPPDAAGRIGPVCALPAAPGDMPASTTLIAANVNWLDPGKPRDLRFLGSYGVDFGGGPGPYCPPLTGLPTGHSEASGTPPVRVASSPPIPNLSAASDTTATPVPPADTGKLTPSNTSSNNTSSNNTSSNNTSSNNTSSNNTSSNNTSIVSTVSAAVPIVAAPTAAVPIAAASAVVLNPPPQSAVAPASAANTFVANSIPLSTAVTNPAASSVNATKPSTFATNVTAPAPASPSTTPPIAAPTNISTAASPPASSVVAPIVASAIKTGASDVAPLRPVAGDSERTAPLTNEQFDALLDKEFGIMAEGSATKKDPVTKTAVAGPSAVTKKPLSAIGAPGTLSRPAPILGLTPGVNVPRVTGEPISVPVSFGPSPTEVAAATTVGVAAAAAAATAKASKSASGQFPMMPLGGGGMSGGDDGNEPKRRVRRRESIPPPIV